MVMVRMRHININDFTDFRRDQGHINLINEIYEETRSYKRPFQIKLEELAIMFFSDYFKRCFNDKGEVKFMIKMLNRIFS